MPIRATTRTTPTVHHTGTFTAYLPPPTPGFELSLGRTTPPGAPLSELDRLRPGQVRGLGRAQLRYWGVEELADDAELVISELVTNAFQHGTGDTVRVWLGRTATHVRIEVGSQSAGSWGDGGMPVPQARQARPMDEGGRGLGLVEALADCWGVGAQDGRVWCAFALPGGS
ncbi:ATP-binding protein [Streptomyces albipurpureus]|uniref:ATP-binding protein n=1 Tax=Streptomyces albipurpureus TaxID=2897419 RepID=A0ABT0UU89_9ACTN|nr:ATP-binding protein [Streptomyces sp. CWNU-1]MCM2392148.1 ATP-binding protein [Streptomyces sp. CWNU-1]